MFDVQPTEVTTMNVQVKKTGFRFKMPAACLTATLLAVLPQTAIPQPLEQNRATQPIEFHHPPLAPLSDDDVRYLLGTADRLENFNLALMNEKEMQETEGKVGPAGLAAIGVGVGFIAGAGSSAISNIQNGQPINIKDAWASGVGGAWAAGSAALAAASGIGPASALAFGTAVGWGAQAGALNQCMSCHSAR